MTYSTYKCGCRLASDEDFDFVHFILEQFRFVDRVVNSKV